MKKIVALVAVLFSVVVPVQSQAAVGERIVIIDDYFNLSVIPGSVEFVCVASDKCVNKAQSSHGTSMALIARKQNPDATLVLVQGATVSKNGKVDSNVYVQALISGLNWVSENSNNVSAVSYSRFLTYGKRGDGKSDGKTNAKYLDKCFPNANGITPDTAKAAVVSAVSSLNSKNIPLIAASGNHNSPIDFPACLPNVVSVGASGMGLQQGYHAASPYPIATIVVDSPNSAQSTSTVTAFVAARYKSINIATTKVVTIP